VHDGIHVEKAGTPSVTICTDAFVQTSRAMASAWGTPDYPVVFTRHPVGLLARDQLKARGEEMIDEIVSILTGSNTPGGPSPT
tara:strand:+ start:71 stop:319 length:249 start_codon:yes stop_codon:yes gene_type:complete